MQKRVAIYLLGFVIIVTLIFGYNLRYVKFDYNFEKFFPESDPETDFFFNYREKFESDNDFVLVGIVNEKGIFRKDFLLKADSLEKQLRKLPDVNNTYSIISAWEPLVSTLLGHDMYQHRVLHIDDPSSYYQDSVNIYSSEIYNGNLVSDDARSICIVINTEQYISKEKSDRLAKNLDRVISGFGFDEVNIAGRSTGQSYYVNLMQQELLFFTITSFLLVVAFLAFTFRTMWGIWVPVVVVVLTVVWIMGYMALLGKGINLVLTVLPTIMFVVGMSDVVHIMTHYLYELRNGKNKADALIGTYKEIGLATFLTSLTTGIGFLTLMTSSIEPVRDFGLYTATGILFAYILAFTLLPGVLLLNKVPAVALNERSVKNWNFFLHTLFRSLIKRRNWVWFSCVIILIFSIWGITKLRFNNFLLEDLRSDNPLKKQFIFFENNFSGVRPFEMAVVVKNKTSEHLLDLENLIELEKLENYLRQNYGTGFLLSSNSVIKSMNKALNEGKKKYYRLPDSQEELNRLIKKAEFLKSKNQLRRTVTDDGTMMRISGKTPDLGSAVFRVKNDSLRSFISHTFDSTRLSFHLTGTAVLIDKNNGQLSSGLVYGLLISTGIVGLIFGLMFFSWKMVVISLLPNIFPILMIGGIMGFLHIDLKVSTSMIFTIAFGIAVDDTIHFLSRYKLERAKGLGVFYAVKRTYLTTGKAIFVTTMILSGGFLTLIFSDFLGTFYIGLLIGLTLIFAVAFDMLLLPLLLMYMEKDKKPED